MESVNKKVIFIAVILSLCTSLLIYIYISKATAKPDVIVYANVYVATKTMQTGYKISDSDVKQAKIARELLNGRAVTNIADLVGKRLKESVIEGEQILFDRLIDENKTILAYNIPQGKRAVSINVNEQIAVSNLFRPGDYVDVIASLEREENESAGGRVVNPRVTKIIIQNVEILALGQDQTVTDGKLKEALKTVTLAVNPQDVEKLVYASDYGLLRLALRPVDEDEIIDTPGVGRDNVISY